MKESADSTQVVLKYRVKEWFPDISAPIHDQLRLMYDEMLKSNKALSLISSKTIAHADLIHFSDSIMGCRAIYGSHPNLTEIFDIGSGNGFPGLVFALLYPKVVVKLVESDSKRCEYLKHLVSILRLANVQILNQTVETLPANSVKVAMARGFANISKSILLGRKFQPSGGIFYHFKSEEWGIEVAQIPTQLCSIWVPSLAAEYTLPVGGVKFAVVKTVKIG